MVLQELPLFWEVSLAVLGSSSVSAALSLCEDEVGAQHAKLE